MVHHKLLDEELADANAEGVLVMAMLVMVT
jgi:hypothetical protein